MKQIKYRNYILIVDTSYILYRASNLYIVVFIAQLCFLSLVISLVWVTRLMW